MEGQKPKWHILLLPTACPEVHSATSHNKIDWLNKPMIMKGRTLFVASNICPRYSLKRQLNPNLYYPTTSWSIIIFENWDTLYIIT